MIYFGFGIADSMFPKECVLRKHGITVKEVNELTSEGKITSCLNPSHLATIVAMKEKGLQGITVPEKAPIVKLVVGDSLIVLAVSGLPRLEGRHEYTPQEIAECKFNLNRYNVE